MAEAQTNATDRKSDKYSGKDKSKSSGKAVLGNTEALGSLVYKIGTSDATEMWARTTKAIWEYVGVLYGYEQLLLVKQREEATFTEPILGNPSSQTTSSVTTRAKAVTDETQGAAEYTPQQLMKYKLELDIYHRKLDKYNDEKAKTFIIILGQCTEEVQSWLSLNGLEELERNRDVIGLLNKLKRMASSQNGDKDEYVVLCTSLRKLATLQQGSKENTARYYERFQVAAEVLVGHWGDFSPPSFVLNGLTPKEAEDRFLGRLFLIGADKARFGQLTEELSNNFASGVDRYPKTLEATLKLLSTYGNNSKSQHRLDDRETRYLKSFAQKGKQVSPSKKSKGNRKGSSAPATDENDSDGTADNGVTPTGARNGRSRSPSRGRREGWSTA